MAAHRDVEQLRSRFSQVAERLRVVLRQYRRTSEARTGPQGPPADAIEAPVGQKR